MRIRAVAAAAALLAVAAPALSQPAPTPATPADEAVGSAEAWRDLSAAVRPPALGAEDAVPADLRAHEARAAEALDPNNPSAVADFRPAGPGCGQGAGLLSCATNQEVGAQPDPDNTDPTPDRDLMGQPR